MGDTHLTPGANEAIHAVRMKRLRKAVLALETALSDGRAVSEALLQVSGLLERGIDPRKIRSAFGDLPRLLEVARSIEVQQHRAQERGARRSPVRMQV